MSPRKAAEQDQYADLLAQLESLAQHDAQAILTDLASAIFPAGSGSIRQVTWEGGDPRPPGDAISAAALDPHAIADAKLRAAELRYRTLVEQIPAVTFMAVLGEGQNEVYVSPHIEALLGFTQREWLDNPFLWYTQLHPEDRSLWHEEFARGCRTGGPFRAECRFIAHDGRVVWVRGEARLIKDERGRPLFLQGVAFDITESRQAQAVVLQEAVRTTEERYRHIVERVGAIFWEADARTGGFTFVSRGAQRMLGFPAERWVGDSSFWLSLVHADDRDRAAAAWQQAIREGGDHEFEFRAITADQRVVWLHNKVHVPVTVREDAKPLGVILDITERKQAEERLSRVLGAERMARREAEALNRVGRSLAAELDLAQLVEQITDVGAELTGADWAAFIRPGEGTAAHDIWVRPANHAARGPLHGLPADALFAPIFSGSTILIEDLRQHLPGALETGLPDELGLRSYLGVPVISRVGEVLGGIFCGHSRPGQFNRDHQRIIEGFAVQTAIALDNAQLFTAAETARRVAESANRAKDEFLATMSHELRTPLNAVLGWVQLLQSSGRHEGNLERGLATIDRNARAQAQIIDDLLDVSRIVTGKLDLKADSVDLVFVIERALEAVALAAGAKQIVVTRELDRSAAIVSGDADRLRQVVTNLMTNAVKFTPHRGRIDVRLDHGEGVARITVADNGQGIDPAYLPHVFDRFWQADSSTTRTHGGLGLGLAIVRHLTEMHGGSVRAESPGHGLGATFTVELPLGDAGDAASNEPAARAERAASAGGPEDPMAALTDAAVLVVDDEADSRDLVVNLFAGAGANVVAASTTAEALRSITRRPPQLVVCDIGMPHEDGYNLIRRLRALDGAIGRIPVIALTAYAREEDRRRALSAGFQAHIAKPFETSELLTVAADLISAGAR